MSVSYEEYAKSNGKPLIVFIKHYESHSFNDRMILVNDEVKIGRAVARLKSTPNNAIFDCKVLSRNHAIISYLDRKFILKDTKSSNGTYVNNTRVNKEDSEYGEREIFSNDIVKFGVEVLEHGLSHGCIVTQVKLFHPDGTEARPGKVSETKTTTSASVRLNNESFFKLENYVVDAIYREGNIRRKAEELKFIMDQISKASEVAWKAMLNEERLLDKIALYESEIQIYKQELPEDVLRNKCAELQGKLHEVELKHKEFLQDSINEKNSLTVKLSETDRKFTSTTDYCKKLEADLDSSKESYLILLNKFDEKNKDLDKLSSDLTEESSKRQEYEKRLTDSQNELNNLKNSMDKKAPVSSMKNGISQNGIKLEDEGGVMKKESGDDHQMLPTFGDKMTAGCPSPASPSQPTSSFRISNLSSENDQNTPSFDGQENDIKPKDESIVNTTDHLSFHDEYRSLQSKLELIEQEMNICKNEQISVKTENKMLKAKLSNIEDELRSSIEKCSRLEIESINRPVVLTNESVTTSQLNDQNSPSTIVDDATSCKSCQQRQLQSKFHDLQNYVLISVMFLILAVMYSIFNFFNPR